ncbi:cell surface A33 antigen-like [Melanotaenia boesemani]|uniref:cell surface A33 antigen-like n=1 Tax=Melanotaenia boesemani TaxID=1250792 RepID=UPI001C051DA0|nr:cell surface A33 antigen-like [Melanotaenia boesemani]
MERRTSCLALLFIVWSGVDAITVAIPQKQYEFFRGENITLPFTFQALNKKPSQASITWSVLDITPDAEEVVIASHYYPDNSTDITSTYEGRLFLDANVTAGKATLKLNFITLNENKKFVCRVQIPKDLGISAATTRVVVLAAPSKPNCKIQGPTEYGQDITLSCLSDEGSPPPIYKWESYDVTNQNRPLPPKATDVGGTLSLYNISKDSSGFYICRSTNKIGSAFCNVTMTVMPPSMQIGSTAGIIGGVLAFLIILVVIICCCCCRKKKNKEEFAMTKHDAEYHDDNPERLYENSADGEERARDSGDPKVTISDPIERRDNYGDKSERYDDRKDRRQDDQRSDYDDRRSDYSDRRNDDRRNDDRRNDNRRNDDRRNDNRRNDDRRSDYDDRRSDYDDRRSDYDDRRSDYNDRRSDYNDRRNDDRRSDDRRRDYDDRRSDYNDRRERYDDDRRDRH